MVNIVQLVVLEKTGGVIGYSPESFIIESNWLFPEAGYQPL